MASSSHIDTSPSHLQYVNKRCYCGRVSAIKVSLTENNCYKLFYTCKTEKCTFFSWCHPISPGTEPTDSLDDEVNTEHMVVRMERELSKVHTLLNAIEKWNTMLLVFSFPIALTFYLYLFTLLHKY